MQNLSNLSQISKLVDLLRKKGVEYVKDGTFEIRLRPEAPPSNYKKKLEVVQGDVETQTPFTEEDALFWSSAGIPEEKAS